jgi:hypothetical protein
MKTALSILFAAAGVLAGCGDETIVDPVPEDAPLITYSRSGGIAFTVQELAVNRDGTGKLTLQEGAKPESRAVELSEAELTSLTELVDAINPAEIEVDSEVACADCYVYDLTWPNGTELEFAEFPEPPSELEPLLTQLSQIVEENSPPNPTGA